MAQPTQGRFMIVTRQSSCTVRNRLCAGTDELSCEEDDMQVWQGNELTTAGAKNNNRSAAQSLWKCPMYSWRWLLGPQSYILTWVLAKTQ
jgi:hypothetical protein